MYVKTIFSELFGFGDPYVAVLKFVNSSKGDVAVADLKNKFGDSVDECIKSLVSDGYLDGVKAPNGVKSWHDGGGQLRIEPNPLKTTGPYHITARGISRLKELRRNTWIFWIPTILSIIALLKP